MKLTESKLRSIIKQELVKFLNEMDQTGMVPRTPSQIGTVEIPSGYRSSGTSNKAYEAQKSSGIAEDALKELLNAKEIIEGKQNLNLDETSSFQASINQANNYLYHLNDERFNTIVDFFEDVVLDTLRTTATENLTEPFIVKRSHFTYINLAIKILNTIIQK